ncbi:MAG: type IV pilus secretin PilQ [Bdellovibrionales bacterium]|nr:type IV pilus secretin PilQ [Bdellovibrionales bacterium]
MNKFLTLSCVMSLLAAPAMAAQISKINLKPKSGLEQNETWIEILGSGLRGFEREDHDAPAELVLTFLDVSLDKSAAKTVDATQFKSNVMQLSAYALNGAVPQSKVVVDFKSSGKYVIEESDARVLIKVKETVIPDVAKPVVAPIATKEISSVKMTASAAEDDNDDSALETAARASEKKFTGSPITLKLKDADVHEVLRLISEASGFNIVVHPAVNGRLTVSLERVPWDQALDVVLTTLKLAAERSQSVLRVMPREMLIAEKQAELEQKKISQSTAPRITRIFPISYVDLGQISSILTTFANAQNSGPGSAGIPATIIVDQNTQSLIVRETADNIERIRKMIQLLDVQTPQVLIEGKVIEASSDFSKTLNGTFGAMGTQFGGAFNGTTATLGNASIGSVASSAGGGSFAATQGLSIFDKPIFLNALLNFAEKESQAKIVSSPRTVVLSGKSASITQTKSVAVQSLSTVNTTSTQSLQTVSANTKLSVTPRVTNDGSVFMKLDLSRDIMDLTDPTKPAVNPRTMNTEVIVDSGSTLVIGGILNLDEGHVEQGMPFLRKLPLFGWLFGQETSTNTKSEVMFFVTPRVLNPRKQGATITEEPASVPAEKL